MLDTGTILPITQAAKQLGMSREALVKRAQRAENAGEYRETVKGVHVQYSKVDGKWFASLSRVDKPVSAPRHARDLTGVYTGPTRDVQDTLGARQSSAAQANVDSPQPPEDQRTSTIEEPVIEVDDDLSTPEETLAETEPEDTTEDETMRRLREQVAEQARELSERGKTIRRLSDELRFQQRVNGDLKETMTTIHRQALEMIARQGLPVADLMAALPAAAAFTPHEGELLRDELLAPEPVPVPKPEPEPEPTGPTVAKEALAPQKKVGWLARIFGMR